VLTQRKTNLNMMEDVLDDRKRKDGGRNVI